MKSTASIGRASAIILLLAGATRGQADDLVCAQCVNTSDIADYSVTLQKLKADSVTSAKIAAGEVKTGDMADHSITAAKLQTNSVSTVKLQADSVTESKLEPAVREKLTAPQIVFAGAASYATTNLTIGLGCQHYEDAEVTITVPGPGKIKVDAQAWLRISGHIYGLADVINVYLGESATECTPNDHEGGYNHMGWAIAPEEPTWDEGGSSAQQTVPVSRTFKVLGAGTYTFYLNGIRASGGTTGGFWFASMQALYFPDLGTSP